MKKFLIANWKMQLGVRESRRLAERLVDLLGHRSLPGEVVLCPSFPALTEVVTAIRTSDFKLGAQDIFWQERGAFTGEVSGRDLAELGVSHVMIGHSERRQFFQETDASVNKKIKAALACGLTPILCVGETLKERREGQRDLVLIRQLHDGLQGIILVDHDQLIVAYEPVWVIGTGQAVNPQDVSHAGAVVTQALIDLGWALETRNRVRLGYGGSVDQKNITQFLNAPGMAGALVGGSSLRAEEFVDMVANLA